MNFYCESREFCKNTQNLIDIQWILVYNNDVMLCVDLLNPAIYNTKFVSRRKEL